MARRYHAGRVLLPAAGGGMGDPAGLGLYTAECSERKIDLRRAGVTAAELSSQAAAALARELQVAVRAQVDQLVDVWHESPDDGRPLHEFLGMTWPEYCRWVRDPGSWPVAG